MKKIIPFTLGILVFTVSLAQKSKAPKSDPVQVRIGVDVHAWIEMNFIKGQVPPFSFTYGGKDSKTFITQWDYSAESVKGTDPNVENSVYTYKDKQTGLVVKCSVQGFKAFHAVEWVLTFTNTSGQNTPVIEKEKVADLSLPSEKTGAYYLHYAKGSNAEKSDFEQKFAKLKTGKSVYMTPIGGRSSDNTAFPFFNIETPSQQGVVVAVGWTGKWFADVKLTDEKNVSLISGMEKMQLVLYPNEQIRTPRICLLFWQGADRMIGHNNFRQFVLAHHTRKGSNGKNLELPFAFGLGFGGPPPCNEYSCATEEYTIAMVNRHKQFNFVPDVFWLDAGWYKGCGQWWEHVGSWTINKNNFPNGFKPVTDAVHKVGAKFLLWFEPERVFKGTDLDIEHPEFLLRAPVKAGDWEEKNSLFNLGDPKALKWMTEHIAGMIKKEGIDHYRQDFNFDPWKYWEANDKPDRIGMSEIRHIEGLYAFWDTLLTRFPNLIIDNCASGGRRIDLETISRSSPLWRTDYAYGEPNGYQCHTFGLNFYLPLHGTGNFNTSTYHLRSSLSSAVVMGMDINANNDLLMKNTAIFKRLRPYFYEDYYPLTSIYNTTPDNVWLAYQLNRPKQNDGIILAFRRPDCNDESVNVKLRGLDEKANYEVFYEDFSVKTTRTGADLMKGMDLSTPLKPGSMLISYKKL
jgi:alpha-galactosidase